MEKNKYIDHTLLKANAKTTDIDKLLDEAKKYNFMSVCVNPAYVSYCSEKLKNYETKVCTVIGFPLGSNTIKTKVFETIDAINNGADEIDMVINVGKANENDFDYIYNEISEIRNACKGHILKVILETCYLTKEQIINVCSKAILAKADFVKTSTGFGTYGATEEDVLLMVNTCNNKCLVKASGGIRSLEDFNKMVLLGAKRIGTSSGVKIMEGEKSNDTNTAY